MTTRTIAGVLKRVAGVCKHSLPKMTGTRGASFMFFALGMMFWWLPEVANAGLPWETPITMIASSMCGPMAKAAAVIAVVVAGIMFSFGEHSGVMKTVLGVVMGTSVALLATSWISTIGSTSVSIACG